jgi:SPP1 gp7 family putative phage head morphogenesis protein
MVMNSQKYWRMRFLKEKAVNLKSQDEYERALNKRLDQMLDIYDFELKHWYSRFSDLYGIQPIDAERILKDIEYKHFDMTLKEFKDKAIKGGYDKQLDSEYFKSQIARLKQLESQLKQQAEDLFSVERFKMLEEMVDEYKHSYYHSTYDIQAYQGHFESNFSTLNTNKLNHILSNPWSNSNAKPQNFSDRIWHNYTEELPSQLMDSMLRNTLTGRNYQQIDRDFKQRFEDVRTKHIHRLVVTELGHVQEEASAKSYEEQDVKKYEYASAFERNTCDICSHLNGKIFYLKDRKTGVNYPLIHPYCKCTTLPVISGRAYEPDDTTFDDFMATYATD